MLEKILLNDLKWPNFKGTLLHASFKQFSNMFLDILSASEKRVHDVAKYLTFHMRYISIFYHKLSLSNHILNTGGPRATTRSPE